ncbi:PEPxxWA-CTERM sorting domain-containing protein [Sphingomonas echinoides]|uniref:PEPxxWA-CTERM sorting domain-containing protein n=1 Tax=Sphingomonas echinoides TaxID=59803 RepID=UPI0024131B28|nr:PEPxxWA-CTERM sorting domain-containing protein [Sphingomonas echinoides]
MKLILRGLLGGALALSATSAGAAFITGQISVAGYAQAVGSTGMGAATGITFANAAGTSVSGSSGTLTSYGAGSGSFASIGSCASLTSGCGTIQNISSFASQGTLQNFVSFSSGLAFDLASVSQVTRPGANQLSFTALGNLRLAGFDPTPGRFFFSAQGDNITSFSSALLADRVTPSVPEPAIWAMMIVGFCLVGGAMRRRQTPVAFA